MCMREACEAVGARRGTHKREKLLLTNSNAARLPDRLSV